MARLPIVGADRDNWGGIINDYMLIEHGAGGFHNISYGNTSSRPSAPEDGQIYINNQLSNYEQYQSGAWVEIASLIPSGTKMIFYQGSAPTGWTKDTTDNDKALRVVSGSGGVTSGTNSFSTTLTSAITTDTEATHTHSTPNHAHPFATSSGSALNTNLVATQVSAGLVMFGDRAGGSGTVDRLTNDTTSSGSGTSGVGSAHSHTKTFDIEYMDVIICSKD